MSDAPLPSWPYEESPFHAGERAAQQRLGVNEKLEVIGRKTIRNLMPEQHRAFFPQLPFVIVGSADAQGQPWASILVGHPGFMRSPDPRHLEIRARPLFADPLHDTLAVDTQLGLLGIEPHTRRRNRMNGTVRQLSAGSFSLQVNRSFGNCPKYIQARTPSLTEESASAHSEKRTRRALHLDPGMCRLIESSDTFYIASAAADNSVCPHGPDVSHRGGKPGFVRVDQERTLTVPDFTGNFFFNTLSNILTNPQAGLLFIDYANGDLLYLAADAEIVWEGAEVEAFPGAQRLLRLHVKEALLVENSLPLRWSESEPSPMLENTGSWQSGNRMQEPG